jgi:hypothetical protein
LSEVQRVTFVEKRKLLAANCETWTCKAAVRDLISLRPFHRTARFRRLYSREPQRLGCRNAQSLSPSGHSCGIGHVRDESVLPPIASELARCSNNEVGHVRTSHRMSSVLLWASQLDDSSANRCRAGGHTASCDQDESLSTPTAEGYGWGLVARG